MGKRVEVCEPLVLCSLVDILNMHKWRKKLILWDGWNDDNDDDDADVGGISAV